MSIRIALLVAVLAGCSLMPVAVSWGDDADPATMCPGYRTALGEARGALSHGKRAEAIAALQKAKDALGRCRHEEIRKTNPLAAADVDYCWQS